jgi:hypothetical protein
MELKLSVRAGAMGVALVIAVGTTACSISLGTGAGGQSPTAAPHPSAPGRTITKYVTVTPSHSPAPQPPAATQAAPAQAPATQPPPAASPTAASPAPAQVPNVTDPWAVVSAYYGDVESGNYAEAYALLSSGMVTGQTYQEFASGYACTGSQTVSENWENGDQVNFNLTAADMCTGATQYFTGTDTVQDGKIVAADVTQTG